ncbi:MAG: efflux RND transporter permease subunit, partial [Gemmatimonadaceae bacterium]|nr:efflux RND transporter permease subunit [Gemmatimonadaceae bacterium]
MIRWTVSRPAVVWAAVVSLVLSGGVAFTRLSLATRTTVELPKLLITAGWTGASAELMEMYLTSPVEAAVQGVRGVRRTSSESREGTSRITVDLDPATDVQLTRLAILERLELLRKDFPAGATTPFVSNYVPEALSEQPLLRVLLTGPYTKGALQRVASDLITPQISALPGVSGVTVFGGTAFGVAITYDASLLRQLDIAPSALSQAVSEARQVVAIGDEHLGTTTRPVVMRDQPATIDALQTLPVRGPGGRIFQLGTLATIRPEEDARNAFFRINGFPAIAFSVTRGAGADAITTARSVRAALRALAPRLPPGVRYEVNADQSEELAAELRDLLIRGAIALGAVMVVLIIMLRNWRAVALVLGSAAISLSGTALGLFILGIPSNSLTLAGLGMGIGVLVQNALVVIERLRAAPDSRESRAQVGSRMFPAVLGSTLTTCVVLFPFLYLQGNARAAFVPFAAAFMLGLGWSVVAAILVIPTLA